MRIVHLIPGSGDTFYCENCMRDGILPSGLRFLGHEAIVAPLYLPGEGFRHNTPIFYGAVGMYLRESFPVLRSAPQWVSRMFDAPPLLKLAGKLAGATDAGGLGGLTVSMLLGEEGRQAKELDVLIEWLSGVRPDVVHLSNGLLMGVARRIKQELKIPLVCSLQDEHTWLDQLEDDDMHRAWEIMRDRAADVDLFLPVSSFYRSFMQERLSFNDAKCRVVPVGVEIDGIVDRNGPPDPAAIGFLSHLNESMGFETLVDAFILLKGDARFADLKLRVTGGYARGETAFVNQVVNRLRNAGLMSDFELVPSFARKDRLDFLKSCTLLTVPAHIDEALGTFQLEAMASGVPVVMPDQGGFREIVETTGGGILYSPNDAETLAGVLGTALSDTDRLADLGRTGRLNVKEHYSLERMVTDMAAALESVCR